MDNQTLEIQLKATGKEALKSLEKLASELKGIEKNVNGVTNSLKKVSTKPAVNEVNSLDKSIKKASNSMKIFKNLFSFAGARNLTNTALNWVNEAIDKTEQMNLFNVVFKNITKNGVQTFSELGRQAISFQNKLNEAFGTNMTETLKFHALFQSMGENVGIPEQYSAIMSETMTKFTYDLASLYNKNEATTAEALRAGVYAGQTKPLRSYGIDVTQTSMQPILKELGIERSISQLSQAEKEILRYIATLRQGQVAMGDFANTIESPSNQIKVFRQQLTESKVAITSLFIGTFSNIIPYANAFLMVAKEIAEAIANMFGIKLQDYNSSIAGQEDAYIDLEDSVNGATNAVKELKRQTLSFDQIHNINANNDSVTSNTSDGIDQRLLDAITGYDNGMDKVKMKATQIRDSIMKWLGFVKETNEETGEISYKLSKTLLEAESFPLDISSITTGRSLSNSFLGIKGFCSMSA